MHDELESAVADHYGPASPAPDPARRQLDNAARFHDPSNEDAALQRAKDPERYDRELAAMGGDMIGHSLAVAGREAAIELGKGTSK